MSEIRYFLDYVKSNEIILEEKKKRQERLSKELFLDNGILKTIFACAVGLYILSLLDDE